MPDEIAIRVQNVSKNFILPHEKVNSVKSLFTGAAKRHGQKGKETQHALKDISFEVKKGEFFGIVGRNGSGKSTLLKIIAGIYQPTRGHISVAGKLVPFIELGVGFNPELTGRENIFLNGALLGFSEKEVSEMYQDIVDFAELERFMDQKLKNYSSGMQVRLAFSVAVRAKADILLIDEVLAVGDADFQRKCFDYFKKLKKENTTVIFVSHNMDAVREYCDRAMLVEDSRVIEIGPTSKISEKYLRLFSQDLAAVQVVQGIEDRWGDGMVKITDADVNAEPKEITVSVSVEVKESIENPIIGFRIRDAAGKYITGTNTKVEEKYLGQTQAGDKAKIKWRFPNLFGDGDYIVDLAAIHDDGVTASDWWNEAAKFKIRKNRHLEYVVDPGFDTTIE